MENTTYWSDNIVAKWCVILVIDLREGKCCITSCGSCPHRVTINAFRRQLENMLLDSTKSRFWGRETV